MKRVLLLGALAGLAQSLPVVQIAQAQGQASPVRANEEQLGQLLSSLGLQPEKKQQRYDFAFQADMEGQKWELSMSAILSHDGGSVWIMAWLDELPKASADVPRSALLRLLAQNDQLGDGKFFAYIPNNRRFVLQRTVPNADLTSAQLRVYLQDLGASVVETYPIWSVANWNPTGTPAAPLGQAPSIEAAGAQSVSNESKFEQPVRR
jgi:hypothetical protein